jgi:uncharacterized membrane protein (DUF2068 family)
VNHTFHPQARSHPPLQAAGAGFVAAPHHKAPLGLRTVAIFELVKGLVVLVAGLGLLTLVHRDAQQIAEEIVKHLHLNPAREFPRIFIDTASQLTDARLWFYSLAALLYAAVRFVEAFGLWHERPWAEWFAVISAGLYLPVEIYHLIDKPGLISLTIPLINIGIVAYLAFLLANNSKSRTSPAPGI